MKNLPKLNVILLAFFIIFSSKCIAADLILPLPKPAVDQEIKIITAKKKEIYPQKKPVIEKITTVENQEDVTKLQKSEEKVVIYPEKKPIIFQKKIDKAVKKSTILSSGDLKIAKAAFSAVKKKKMANCYKTFKKSKK